MQRSKTDVGQTDFRAFLSSLQLSVRMTWGPCSRPRPLNAYSGKQDRSISKPCLSVRSCSSLVIKMPSGSAPDTLFVHIKNTLRLCSSVLEVASTKTISPDCCTSLCTRFMRGVTIAIIRGVSSPSYIW